MGISKDELIKKLEAISVLYKQATSIKIKMNDFEPEDNYKRKVKVPNFPLEVNNEYDEKVFNILTEDVDHTVGNAKEHMSKCYDTAYQPKKPSEPFIKEFSYSEDSVSKNKRDKLGCFSYVALAISGFCLLSIILGTAEGAVGTILVMTIIGALAFAFLRLKLKNEKKFADKKREDALAEYNRNKEALLEEHKNKMKDYENQCKEYESTRQEFLNKYMAWREIYLESVSEEAKISSKLEKDRQSAVDKIEEEEFKPVLNKLVNLNDLVTNEYLPVLDTIIDLLRSGRADDLKEAINLYEDIVYRERQLDLEREKEEQRRWEEEQRRKDEERHHQEQMRFQQDQERQRQREEERRQQDAERRHREEMDQRDKQERERQNRANEERRRAEREELDRKRKEDQDTHDQCQRCAHVGHCTMAFRRPNCASFRPR